MKPQSDRARASPVRATGSAGGPTPPIDSKWSWHYRTLLALRRRLARDTSAKLQEVAEPLEPHSLHAGDSGTDEFDRDLALTLLASEENALIDVNDAIARIDRGTYGICEVSKAKISAARLRALPWCRTTRAVEEQLERTGVVRRARLPRVASLRGKQPDIPADGDLPREGSGEDEEVEPEETRTARIIRQVSSLPKNGRSESDSPFEMEPGSGRIR